MVIACLNNCSYALLLRVQDNLGDYVWGGMTSFALTFVASMPRTTGARRHRTALHVSRKWRMLHRPSTANMKTKDENKRTREEQSAEEANALVCPEEGCTITAQNTSSLATTVVSGTLSCPAQCSMSTLLGSLFLPMASRTTLGDALRSRRGHWKMDLACFAAAAARQNIERIGVCVCMCMCACMRVVGCTVCSVCAVCVCAVCVQCVCVWVCVCVTYFANLKEETSMLWKLNLEGSPRKPRRRSMPIFSFLRGFPLSEPLFWCFFFTLGVCTNCVQMLTQI